MKHITAFAAGLFLAWLVGVNMWDIPLSEVTVGMMVRNVIALGVFYLCLGCAE